MVGPTLGEGTSSRIHDVASKPCNILYFTIILTDDEKRIFKIEEKKNWEVQQSLN